MRRDDSSPAAYRKDVESPLREILEKVRSGIFKVAPKTEEGIRHGMLDYPSLANLAGQKAYVGLYVAPSVLEAHPELFPGVDRGRSCLRFTKLEQVKAKDLTKLLRAVRKFRKEQAAEQKATK